MALKEANRMLREFEKRMEGSGQGNLLRELNSPMGEETHCGGNHVKHNYSSEPGKSYVSQALIPQQVQCYALLKENAATGLKTTQWLHGASPCVCINVHVCVHTHIDGCL